MSGGYDASSVDAQPLRAALHRRVLPQLPWFVALACAMLAITTFRAIRSERQQALGAWERQLSIAADDRISAVDHWIADQAGHARLIAAFPATSAALSSAQGDVTRHLAAVLASASRVDPDSAVRVFDRNLRELAVRPDTAGECDGCAALARRAADLGRGVVEQQLATPSETAVIVFAEPVFAPGEGTNAGARSVVGAVTLVVRADRWLYPYLARSLFGTTSGETVLVERRGNQAVYLSPLRHIPGSPGSVHVPLDRPRFAAAEALAGRAVFGRFQDYRDVAVLSVTRQLKNAPWGLISKIDESEALRQISQPLWLAAAQLALALLGFLALGSVWLLRARSRWNAMENRVAGSEIRLAAFLDQANDAIFLADERGRVLEANRRAEELYGYTAAELRGLAVRDLRAAGYWTDSVTDGASTWTRVGQVVDSVHVNKSGVPFPVELSTRGFEQGGVRLTMAVVRELTERHAHEERIRHLNRVLRTLSMINRAMVAAVDRQSFLECACNILVDAGEYAMAWVGLVDPLAGVLVPFAAAGAVRDARNGTDTCPIRCDDSPLGNGLSGQAVRTGRRAVSGDVLGEPSMAPWHERLRALGHRSAASFPLVVREQVVGVLSIHAAKLDAFQTDDLELLDELALDLGHGVERLLDRQDLGVTEARLRESLRATQESSARFLSVFEHAPMGIGLTDANSQVLCAVNPALARMLGYAPEELVGVEPERIWQRNELGKRAALLDRLRSGDLERIEFEAGFRRRDGAGVPIRGMLTLIRSRSGEARYVLGVFEDESAHRAAQVEISKLSRAVEQSPVLVMITDRCGTIEYVNRKFREVTGYSAEEVIGQNPRILKSGEMPADGYEHLWATLRAGGEWRGEFHNRKKNGELYWEDAAISALRDEHGNVTHFIAVKEDVTARKLAEVRLREVQDQLAVAQKMEAVGLLAGGVAHDFNNLLSAILGFSELANATLGAGHPAAPSLAQVIAAGRRAADLTRQLLVFSRQQVIAERVIDVRTLLADLEKMLRRLIGEHIRFTTDLASGLPSVLADPGQLEQVVVNLVVNARDAMPDGGTLRIEASLAQVGPELVELHPGIRAGAFVRIRVEDSGCGISDAVRARMFEPFFTTKEAGKGTGLGLSTVYAIVHKAGGFIEVRSVVGRGTSFAVHLPAADRAFEADAPAKPSGAGFPRGSEWVLVVEDDDTVRAVVSQILRSAGYRVLDVSGPDEALSVVARVGQPVDLLITDVVMPAMNGRLLAERIHAMRPDLPVIFLSGYADEELVRSAMLARRGTFLQKPAPPAVILATVREVLDRNGGSSNEAPLVARHDSC